MKKLAIISKQSFSEAGSRRWAQALEKPPHPTETARRFLFLPLSEPGACSFIHKRACGNP